jgi:hypothetical protein
MNYGPHAAELKGSVRNENKRDIKQGETGLSKVPK